MDRRRVRPTVEQVAERAGVSKATVSNALNGTGRLSPETRRRVITAAHELSYVPYTSAFAQARGGTGMLGLTMAIFGDLAVPYTQNPYYSELILGAIGAAHARGYLLTVLPATMSAWSWLTTPVDGVVHCEPRLSDPVRPILERRGIPLVYAGRPPEPRAGDFWVDTDDGQGLVGLLDHLGIDKAIFCGHDWGGIVVWQMPLMHPDRVAGVIGLNTPFLHRAPVDPIMIMRNRFGPVEIVSNHFYDPDGSRMHG